MLQVKYSFQDGREVIVRELKVSEHLMLGDSYSGTKLVHELVKTSVVSVGGSPWTADNRDSAWGALSSKDRDLLIRAYTKLHTASEEEQKSFFAGEAVIVKE